MGILALNIGLKHASEVIDIPVSIVQWDILLMADSAAIQTGMTWAGLLVCGYLAM